MLSNRGFRLAVAPWLAFLMLFPVLSVDVMMRLIAGLAHQDRANLALLVYFESMRTVRSAVVLALVFLLLGPRIARRDARALVWFLLFGGLAYAIAFGGGPYVGPFQEWLTHSLMDLGMTRPALRTVFGYPWWPAWPALAGLLRFALLFPKPLEIAAIDLSGRNDRAGLMRGVPGAGFDIGAATRAALQTAVERGWLGTRPVWLVCIALSALSIALQDSRVLPLLWIPLLFGVGLTIAALRAGYVSGDEIEKRQIRWVSRGASASVLLFLLACVVGLLDNGPAVAITGILLVTLVPAVFIAFITKAVLSDTEQRVAAAHVNGSE